MHDMRLGPSGTRIHFRMDDILLEIQIIPPLPLTTIEQMPPRNISLVQSLDPHSYGKDVGNPFWESTMQEKYESLLEKQIWDLVPINSYSADGCT